MKREPIAMVYGIRGVEVTKTPPPKRGRALTCAISGSGAEGAMAYSAEISRDNPTAILFLIDQSASMDEKMTTGKTKADFVADVLNKTIYTLAINCTKSDGVRHYFESA
jgi:hypothetical protein